ncbi:MAG: glycogen debranching enzyme, partial [Planctomycetota bacterium]
VWPWLLGSYVELCLLARGATGKETKRLDALFVGVERELLRAGLGHVSEVFDGDTPRQPGGTMAQAWNTAELLRARALLASGRGRA